MDYITEVESELANFTQCLYQGISEIQQKSETLDQASRVKLINSLSSELLSSHSNVVNSISKIPEELFSTSRESQEAEIKSLELKYEQSVSRLSSLKDQAKAVFISFEQNLDKIK